MKRCPICRSKNFKIIKNVVLCMSCENIINNDSKNSTIEMLALNVDKEKEHFKYNQDIQKTQVTNKVKKPYLRFQFRVI